MAACPASARCVGGGRGGGACARSCRGTPRMPRVRSRARVLEHGAANTCTSVTRPALTRPAAWEKGKGSGGHCGRQLRELKNSKSVWRCSASSGPGGPSRRSAVPRDSRSAVACSSRSRAAHAASPPRTPVSERRRQPPPPFEPSCGAASSQRSLCMLYHLRPTTGSWMGAAAACAAEAHSPPPPPPLLVSPAAALPTSCRRRAPSTSGASEWNVRKRAQSGASGMRYTGYHATAYQDAGCSSATRASRSTLPRARPTGPAAGDDSDDAGCSAPAVPEAKQPPRAGNV
eukprot:364796-Chlamydomonas_euryale.AAC.16